MQRSGARWGRPARRIRLRDALARSRVPIGGARLRSVFDRGRRYTPGLRPNSLEVYGVRNTISGRRRIPSKSSGKSANNTRLFLLARSSVVDQSTDAAGLRADSTPFSRPLSPDGGTSPAAPRYQRFLPSHDRCWYAWACAPLTSRLLGICCAFAFSAAHRAAVIPPDTPFALRAFTPMKTHWPFLPSRAGPSQRPFMNLSFNRIGTPPRLMLFVFAGSSFASCRATAGEWRARINPK